ncbi:ATP-binding protein [Mediterraneibacter gnavus]|uniref:ATP-binding protein n=1 Tax=Mediterraneibacter gnavus TaxID=33038 RepID=UPI0032C1F6DA
MLIIDEWLLLKLTEAEARNLFELIHKRRKKSSTIFCSQFREGEWFLDIGPISRSAVVKVYSLDRAQAK